MSLGHGGRTETRRTGERKGGCFLFCFVFFCYRTEASESPICVCKHGNEEKMETKSGKNEQMKRFDAFFQKKQKTVFSCTSDKETRVEAKAAE